MTLNITATIKFLEWQQLYHTERPFYVFPDIPPEAEDQRKSNLVFKSHSLSIQDTRPNKDAFQLDKNGFAYRNVDDRILSFSNFSNRQDVEASYLPMIVDFLKTHVEAVDRVFFFDWRLRRSTGSYQSESIDLSDLTNWLLPVDQAHIRQSPIAVVNRVIRQLPHEADFLLQGRVRVINIWRPLFHPVEEWPLAVCDATTVQDGDKVETDHIRRHYTGSTIFLKHDSKQKWYWLSKQRPEEALLMKMFDSESHPATCSYPTWTIVLSLNSTSI